MTTTPTPDDPLMDLVKKLDPVLEDQPAALADANKQHLFEQIVGRETSVQNTATDTDTGAGVVSIGRAKGRRKSLALPGAIAAAVAVMAAVLFLGFFRAPSAEAVLIEAAERTALIESGHVQLTVALRAPAEISGVDFGVRYAFEGDDYRLEIPFNISPGQPVGAAMTELRVDGKLYLGDSVGGGPTVWSVNDRPGSFVDDIMPGLSVVSAGPETVLPLVHLAQDYRVIETEEGSEYRGTISREALLNQAELPFGVAIVASGNDPASELPESLVLEVLIVDDLVQQLVLLVEGDLPSGEFLSATVTTTYTEHGRPQNIVAPEVVGPGGLPPAAAGLDDNEVVALPPEAGLQPWVPGPDPQTEDERALAEVLSRRPMLCFEAGLENPQDRASVSMLEQQNAVLQCFLDEGEPAAADAVRNMLAEFVAQIGPPSWAPGPAPQTDDEAVIAEVIARRPGLCFDAGWPKNPQPGQVVTNDEIRAGVVDCFANAGEGEAALAASRLPAFDE